MAPRRSWAKADNPFWSNHVAAWYRSALEAEHYCRKHDLSTTSLMRWARHRLSAEELRKRAEHQHNLPRQTSKRQHKKEPSNRQRRPRRYRYGVRTDSGPVALQAFWGMHIESMNFSGMGHAEYAAALGLSPHSLRIWRDRLEQSGNEIDWRSLLHPSARAQLSSAANCARCKYRLTPQEADGRSNRRRFTDEQKWAMVQETEKPNVAVAEVCRPAWHCYQPAVPLAGPVRSDSPKGVTPWRSPTAKRPRINRASAACAGINKKLGTQISPVFLL